MTNRGSSLLLDTAMFICFAALLSWRMTGVAAHEWIGLSLIALIVTHLIVHWGWVESQLATAARRGRRGLVPFLLNAALYVAMGATLVSGVVISKVVVPNQLSPESYLLWHGLHETATTCTVIILGVHVALNWDHIRGWVRRRFAAARRAPVGKRWWRVSPETVLRRLGWIVAVSTVLTVGVWGFSRLLPAPGEVTIVFADGHMERHPPPAEISRLSPEANRPTAAGAIRILINLVLLSVAAAASRRALRWRLRGAALSRATRAPPVAAP